MVKSYYKHSLKTCEYILTAENWLKLTQIPRVPTLCVAVKYTHIHIGYKCSVVNVNKLIVKIISAQIWLKKTNLPVVVFFAGLCQLMGRSRAGRCWSWLLCCTWPCCWVAQPSSTSPWATSWLSPWCLWLPSSHPTSHSKKRTPMPCGI